MSDNNQVKPKAVLLDLDAIMDTKVAGIENIADFITPPSGIYDLLVKDSKIEKFKVKDENKKETGEVGQRIVIQYEIKKVHSIDQRSGEEVAPAEGSLFTERFQGTEDGLKYFKKTAGNIVGSFDFGDATIKDLIDGIKTTEFKAKITARKSTYEGKEFTNITVRAANPVAGEPQD